MIAFEGPTVPEPLIALARRARTVTVLSGAGMSAESGVPTFRDAQAGLWEEFDPMMLATPEAWRADPPFVWAWYAWRVALVRAVHPNAGHRALADWSSRLEVLIATQNVDDLHERAGSSQVHHLHGSIGAFRCGECGHPFIDPVTVPDEPVERLNPPACGRCFGLVRPGVVWFGESLPPDAWAAGVVACENADLVLVVGTSGMVYPAAGLPALAGSAGAFVAEINPLPTEISAMAHLCWRASAAAALPALLAAITAVE